MVTTTSPRLTPFLAAHEGFVSKAYRCPAGVLTIGYGMTSRSKVFDASWRSKKGRGLAPGDTISRAEADQVLERMLEAEYAPPVARALGPAGTQHAFDGATSVSYNCGGGALKWKWAQALARGAVRSAAELLRSTAVTANGRRLPGLVRRRAEEAALIEHGNYGHAVRTPGPDEEVLWYQAQLKTLGAYAGAIDGRKATSDAAVRAWQKAQGLVVDGDVGPATRAAIVRALDARTGNRTAAGSGAAAGAGDAAVNLPAAPDPLAPAGGAPVPPDGTALDAAVLEAVVVLALVAGAVWIGFWLWRNRGRLFTGRRVPT